MAQHWEYQTVHANTPGDLDGQLNLLGTEGWEVASMAWAPPQLYIVVLKRPRQEATAAPPPEVESVSADQPKTTG